MPHYLTSEEVEMLNAIRRLVALCRGYPAPSAPSAVLTQILQEIRTMSDRVAQLTQEISALQSDVAAQTTVIGSATTAFQGLAAQIAAAEQSAKDAGATDAQLAGIVAVRQGVEANTAALAAAIPANTSAAPAPADQAPQPAQPTLTPDAPAPALTPDQPAQPTA